MGPAPNNPTALDADYACLEPAAASGNLELPPTCRPELEPAPELEPDQALLEAAQRVDGDALTFDSLIGMLVEANREAERNALAFDPELQKGVEVALNRATLSHIRFDCTIPA